ncbi:uncharacterized protein HMPREF1541_06495 [Cyphellophora europaea CBS 101466]|uniref:Extracellular membrane protein CFEM domain-containing protein n=1 Tax=Cyphellophora europaea (strain CBS 101466) TaxID=1220924 RepID=W2RQ77_CYPE1|nr:uncharacterized protein HMPREF1541_06495 [Cyphellophora europaea CBS 101466]ETN38460.1 hypothetical protein HMPREF1541_06495 [Cyphellophora europaea CBS 101466]
MRPTLQLFALLLTPLLSSAQNFVPSTGLGNFPACAANCAVLQQAQSTCLAQTGQQSSSLAAENCFCQSPTLQALYTTPDAVCVAECPTQQPDRVNLRTWFTSFCSQVGQGVDPNAPTTSTTIVTSTSTNTNGPTSTSGSTSSGQQQSNNKDESWFAGHWQWIVMVIVLAIGLGALAWLLIFLRNRHRRKLDERRAQIGGFPTEREKARGAQSATPDLWGPHQVGSLAE